MDVEGAVVDHHDSINLVDFIAGFVSGCAGIAVGQPFDTIKVRVQTAAPHQYRGAYHCFQETVAKEGPAALFKGVVPPIATAAIVNAITFTVYAETNRWWLPRTGSPAGRLELYHHFVSGSVAGAVQAVVVIPTDNIKVKLQVQEGAITGPGRRALQFKGSIDCARQVLATEGVTGLFRGSPATIMREVPAYGLYFAAYEGAKATLMDAGASHGLAAFVAGGTAGTLSWVSVYPFDVVKSVQQSSRYPHRPETTSMTACFQTVYRQGGLRSLYRGVSAAIVRAFPVNAVIFPCYEGTVALLQSNRDRKLWNG